MKRKQKYYNYKTRNSMKNYIIGFAVFMASVIGLIVLSFYLRSRPYVTVGDYYLTESEYNYYYQLSIDSMQSSYGDLVEYLDVDFTQDLKKQYMEDGTSWHDYFVAQTDIYTYDVLTAMQLAQNDNQLDVDIASDYTTVMDTINSYAVQSGMDTNTYLRTYYDSNFSLASFEKCVKYDLIANKYLEEYAEKTITDEHYDKHYEENYKNYDIVKYYYVTFMNEDQEKNKTDANALMETIKSVEDIKNVENVTEEQALGTSSCDSLYAEWLFNKDETANMKVFEVSDNKSVTLVYKESQEKVNEITKTIHYLNVSKTEEMTDEEFAEKQETIRALVEDSDKSLDALTYIAEANGDNNMLFKEENAIKDYLPDEIAEWLYKEDTKENDIATFTIDDIFYVVLYEKDGEDQYKAMSEYSILQEIRNDKITTAQETYTFEKRK